MSAPVSIYECDPDQVYIGATEATTRISRLYGLARVGAAASDTHLNIDLHKGGYQELFEVMHGLINSLFADVERLERMAGLPYSDWTPKAAMADRPATLYAEWKDTTVALDKAAMALPKGSENTSEMEGLENWIEVLSKQISAYKPDSIPDCAAMMQWVTDEIEEGLEDPSHKTAQRSVNDYLQKLMQWHTDDEGKEGPE